MWTGPITNPQENYQRLDGPSGEDDATLLVQGLRDAILDLRRAGKRVFVAEDTPYWTFNPAKALRIRSIPARNVVQQMAEPDFDTSSPFGKAWAPLMQVDAQLSPAAAEAGAKYLLIRRSFCVSQHCRYRTGEIPLFTDQSHLSSVGAQVAITDHRSALLNHAPSN
jgi:hypothetical protein